MEKVIVLVGPTGIGKTKLSVRLATLLKTEIINGDAFQIYKEMNIGTAKVREEEKQGIVHHLFDIVSVEEPYSVQEYQKQCREKIKEINNKGMIPIIVGGTGLYLKASLFDYDFPEETEEINMEEFEKMDNEKLHKYLSGVDPISAIQIHKNNRKRVLRAIEIYKRCGTTKSSIVEKQEHKLLYDCLFIGLETDRETLYKRCDERVEKMIKEGLVEEAKALYEKCRFKENLTSLQAIGYKEMFEYFKGDTSLNNCIDLIKQRTRNYVKRQYTWFKKQIEAKWINVDFDNFDNSVKEAETIIKEWL